MGRRSDGGYAPRRDAWQEARAAAAPASGQSGGDRLLQDLAVAAQRLDLTAVGEDGVRRAPLNRALELGVAVAEVAEARIRHAERPDSLDLVGKALPEIVMAEVHRILP